MVNGEDTLGKFIVSRWETKCGVCGKRQRKPRAKRQGKGSAELMLFVVYQGKPTFSPYVSQARSLLMRNKTTGKFTRIVGITCGCYSKVHRQIAHIESSSRG